MASKEITVKFTYANGNSGSKTFSGLLTSLDNTTAVSNINDYAKIVDGTVKSAVIKSVEDLNING